MRIEKVNENQIRCTLTKEDLANRKLKLSELAYGSEKAKTLFRDMMQQASFEFGFEAEDIPLMIEAIPVSSECIVLIITKVDDPEELDTRFAKFAPSVIESNNPASSISDLLENLADGADDVLDLFKKLQSSRPVSQNPAVSGANASSFEEMSDADAKQAAKNAFKNDIKKKLDDATKSMTMVRIYAFDDIDSIIKLSKLIVKIYDGDNSLYKDANGDYLLSVTKSDLSPQDFNKVCNIISEYGSCVKSVNGAEAYLAEHHEPIICHNAVQMMAQV